MMKQCILSNVTKQYLDEFYCILEKMIQEMTQVHLNNSISQNFIVQMIPHHKAAIEMSENILKYTTNITIQNIAERIINEQTESIEKMEEAQSDCACFENTQKDLYLYNQKNEKILQTMFYGMKKSQSTNRINCNFMREMIPHHEGAVRMSENALKYDICPELIPILKSIITSQKHGIMQMTNLLRCLECQ